MQKHLSKIYLVEYILMNQKTPPKLNEGENNILNCIYSRHNNSFVRQKYIKKMVENKNYW